MLVRVKVLQVAAYRMMVLGDVLEIIINGASKWLCMYRDVRPKELAVACGDSAQAIDTHRILVKLANPNDNSGLVPFGGMWASLILNPTHGHQPIGVGVSWCVPFICLQLSYACFLGIPPWWLGCQSKWDVACSNLAGWV